MTALATSTIQTHAKTYVNKYTLKHSHLKNRKKKSQKMAHKHTDAYTPTCIWIHAKACIHTHTFA